MAGHVGVSGCGELRAMTAETPERGGYLMPGGLRSKNFRPPERHELSAMILAAAADRGLTQRGIAKVTGLPLSTVHNLVTGPSSYRLRVMPRPVTLEALAAGLDLRLEDVQRAAARAAGVRIEVVRLTVGGRELELSVEVKHGGPLRPDDVAGLERVVEEWLGSRGRGSP